MRSAATPSKSDLFPRGASFHYGWRYVKQQLPNGRTELVQVPLTLDDLLHPQEDDFAVVSEEHTTDCRYLGNVLGVHVPAGAHLFGDHRIVWGDPVLDNRHGRNPEAYGPDAVVFDKVKTKRRLPGATFYVKAERARAVFAIEIVSPDSRRNDTVHKVKGYYRVGVEFYFVVDTRYHEGKRVSARVIAYRRGPDGYEEFAPNEHGRYWLEVVNLWLGIDGVQVRLYDPQGNPIPDYAGVNEAWKAEEAARKAEEAARKAAEERVRQLEEQLRRVEGKSRTRKNGPTGAGAAS